MVPMPVVPAPTPLRLLLASLLDVALWFAPPLLGLSLALDPLSHRSSGTGGDAGDGIVVGLVLYVGAVATLVWWGLLLLLPLRALVGSRRTFAMALLLTRFVRSDGEAPTRLRALSRGALTLLSPFFAAGAFLCSLLPELQWLALALAGLYAVLFVVPFLAGARLTVADRLLGLVAARS